VAAVNDTSVEGSETANISFGTSSADTRYHGLSVAPVSVAITDNDQPPAGIVAVNAGGPAVTASGISYLAASGISYLADQYFSGGATYQVSAAIANTTDDALYQTVRYGQTFGYALPVANGNYSVTLQFAEIYFNAPGQRVFDVTAEGALVIDDLDVWSAAGGQYVAKDVVVPVSVQDGTLNLQFLASVENAKVSAIRVDQSTAGRYWIADAGTDQKIVELLNGSTIDQALLAGKSLTIVGEGPGESFKFNFDNGAVTRTESAPPYALMGDQNGDLAGGLTLSSGSHTLVTDIYSGNNGTGTTLGHDMVNFFIV
jgi:hypothetical protein